MVTQQELLDYVHERKVHKAYNLATALNHIIEHHGIKGQKWGVRRKRNSSGRVSSAPDISKLSDQELRAMVSRMQLEKQFRDLSKSSNKTIGDAGAEFAKSIMKELGKEHTKKLITKGGAALATALFAKKAVSG